LLPGVLWRSVIALILALCMLILSSRPAAALSPGDYFSFDYNVAFSKSEVTGSDLFYATITADATCTRDLPWPYSLASQVSIEGRIVARHQTTGARVTLNSGYTINVSPFPREKNESVQQSKDVSLKFPSGSQSGVYTVEGELVEVKVKVLFGEVDATSLFPGSQVTGSVAYTASTVGGGNGGGVGGDEEDDKEITPLPPEATDVSGITAVSPDFVISELEIEDSEVNIGEAVSISALVTNSGRVAGNYKVTLRIDSRIVDTRVVTLEGGTAEEVTFTVSEQNTGEHTVDIEGLSGTFMVRVLPESVGEPESPAPVEQRWPLGGTIAAAVALAGVGILLTLIIHRHRREVQ